MGNKVNDKIVIVVFLLIILYSFLPFSFGQEYKKYDQYDCIIEKVLQECANKPIWLTYEDKFQELTDSGRKNSEFLRKFLIDKENQIITYQAGSMTTTTHFLMGCSNPNRQISTNETLTLSYLNDHFLWEGHTIDCAWVKNEFSNITLSGKCPTFIVGDNNQLSQDCRDSTLNISMGEFVLISLGGLTIFGVGISFLVKFIVKRKYVIKFKQSIFQFVQNRKEYNKSKEKVKEPDNKETKTP